MIFLILVDDATFFFFFNFSLLTVYSLRERERMSGEGQRERRERIPSRLHTVSTEPAMGLEPTNREITDDTTFLSTTTAANIHWPSPLDVPQSLEPVLFFSLRSLHSLLSWFKHLFSFFFFFFLSHVIFFVLFFFLN